MSPATFLIIVRPSSDSVSTQLSAALLELGCAGTQGGAFEGRIHSPQEPALLRLALVCASESAMLILHAEHEPDRDGAQPYRRLWDRTDLHQAQIAAWRQGMGVLPVLRPGDLIRL